MARITLESLNGRLGNRKGLSLHEIRALVAEEYELLLRAGEVVGQIADTADCLRCCEEHKNTCRCVTSGSAALGDGGHKTSINPRKRSSDAGDVKDDTNAPPPSKR